MIQITRREQVRRNTRRLLKDYRSFTASLAITGSMTPDAWELLYKLNERTNKLIAALSERPKNGIQDEITQT